MNDRAHEYSHFPQRYSISQDIITMNRIPRASRLDIFIAFLEHIYIIKETARFIHALKLEYYKSVSSCFGQDSSGTDSSGKNSLGHHIET